ncbi:MAG: PAS domain-containing protein [Candidatus Hydrogenedentes bacterium]|nr:PAS domain-containing protein [Candidatus Hydrogenedentota bacterium]
MFRVGVIRRAACRVALRYAFFSSVYILFSDQAVYLAFDDPGLITSVQSIKGWAFVTLSSVVIYILMVRELVKIEQAEKALREQRSFLNAVLENSPAVMYLKDPAGRIISANPRFCSLFQHTPEELTGKSDYDIFSRETADLLRKNDLDVLESRATMNFQEEVPHPDGTVHTYLSVKFPVDDAQGGVSAICGISTDITEFVSLEEKLQRTERLNALGRLTGGIAHDFNNHLTVIIGCLQLLQGGAVSDEERINLAREGSRASFQAASLIDRLLSFARNQILLVQEVDVNKSIRDMHTLITRSLGETITVKYALDPGGLCALLDPVQLESAILNLAINARDAMPEGGVLSIATALEEVDERFSAAEDIAQGLYVRIDVADTGNGMAPEVLERVLEPFYTTKEPGKGTGLGLSMVDGFARQSKGCIRLNSAPGRGTTVTILVPAVHVVTRKEADAAVPVALVRPGRGEAILLVEDEPALRAFATRVLEANGYRVYSAADATEAVSLMESGVPLELLFSDIMLPGGVLGPELAQQFQERFPGKGVLLTSGYAEPGVWNTGPRAEILKKPYGREALLAAVRGLIQPN